MAVTIILAAAVAAYAGFVIRKKVKDIKKGKFCSCSGSCADKAAGGRKRRWMSHEDHAYGSECQIYTF